MTTPSEQLAEIVVNRLPKEGLLLESDAAKLQSKLEKGTLKSEDWRLAVEKVLLKEEKDEQAEPEKSDS